MRLCAFVPADCLPGFVLVPLEFPMAEIRDMEDKDAPYDHV
jgi:hypothetical protein